MGRIRVVLTVVAALVAGQAGAQVSSLPPDLQRALAEIGPGYQRDFRAGIPATVEAFRAVLSAAPRDGVTLVADQAYGPDPKQVVDVFRPTARTRLPVLIFVHGGAYTLGDKNAYGEVYSNVGYWFARQGILAVNANYRLAPGTKWPGAAQDVGAIIGWARENVSRFGGDPERIFIMGHSAGATHVAGFVFDKALHPATGPGVAGVVLMSGRYRLVDDPADPNAPYMRAYFGDDPAQYPARSPITHVKGGRKIPVFVVVAEYENPGLDVRGTELLNALCERDSACPRFMRLLGHNHMSEVTAFNTPDELLGRETLDFMRQGR